MYNECGDRCRCSNGNLVECTRIRKEFNTMTTAERRTYINAIKIASTDPRYKADYDRLLTSHRILFNSQIHEQEHFLTWHRWFILQYENLLRKIDCTVTVAYWDWSQVSGTAWRGEAQDIWFTGDSGFGGNGGVTFLWCVQTGPFREAVWKLVPSANFECLSRQFIDRPPDSIAVQEVLNTPAGDFKSKFEFALRGNLHDTVHCLISGTMCTADAASAPEFFLHHGFIDKIWADWQAKSDQHKNAFFPTVSGVMPGTQLTPRSVIDLNAQPGGVRVEYRRATRAAQIPGGKR